MTTTTTTTTITYSTSDPSWTRPFLPFSEEDKASAILTFQDLVNGGGLSASMKILHVHLTNGHEETFLIKSTNPNSLSRSQALGLAREGVFYQTLAPQLITQAHLPLVQTYHVYANMSTGERWILMEDLRKKGLQSGYFFGPSSPLNWARDLEVELRRSPRSYTAKEVARRTFLSSAKMHRLFWMDAASLLVDKTEEQHWLRGVDWIEGKDKEGWWKAQEDGRRCWEKTQLKIKEGTSGVRWDDNLLETMNQAMASISWERYQEQVKTKPWTLVHGDHHPANIMWIVGDNEEGDYPLLVDFEVVGLGSGPQDIAQYLISHMVPTLRKEVEMELLRDAYYATLTDPALPCHQPALLTPETYPFEACYRDYVEGGSERWLWLLAFLSDLCPDAMVQYFADQTAAFLRDHGVTKDTIAFPRV